MTKANINITNYERYQQANNNKHIYINKLLFIVCLLTNVCFGQDSTFMKYYYPSGELSSEGFFINNLPAGNWTNYYKNGQVKSSGFRKGTLLDSTWIFYDLSGCKTLEENYLNNKKHGLIIKYDSLEKIKKISNFKEGLKSGEELIYFSMGENKIFKKNYYLKNKMHGFCFEYDLYGNIITIIKYDMGIIIDKEEINRRDRDGKKHGIWKEFYKNGKVKKEEKYFHGLKDGILKKFDKYGRIEEIENFNKGEEEKKIKLEFNISKENLKDGSSLVGVIYNNKKHGLFKVYNKNKIINYQYYDNDTLIREGMFDSINQKTGKWIYYWPNNKIKKQGYFKEGKKDSIWEYYYIDGIIQQKGKFKNNVPEQKWTWWYNNKQIKREETYLNGKEEGYVYEYDSTGKILTKGNYFHGEREGEWYYILNDYMENGNYIGGMKTGEWKTTYINTNKIKFSGEYLNDLPIGEHKEYYPSGKIKLIGKYKSGKKTGEWKKYNLDGEIIVTYLYKNGIEIKRDGFKIKQ